MKFTHLQDQYLNKLRRDKIGVTVYLVNGVPIKGIVVAFDAFVVLFEVEGKQQLVFKHAISTFQAAESIEFNWEAAKDEVTS